jgi:CheY-like chemotaxis protein
MNENDTFLNEIEILLAEDNPSDAELAMRALRKNKISEHVQVVKDGAEAVDFIFATGRYSERNINNRPKVILLDLKLPKLTGLEVLEKMRSDERTKLIPVVVLTSSREDSDVLTAYELGVNSYIVKPVDFEKYINAVANVGLYWVNLNQPPV